jgi:hypothetical protein
MPIDPRIALQAIGIQAPDVLGAMAQGQQYRQNQMAQQAAQATAQRNMMARERLAALQPDDEAGYSALVSEFGDNPLVAAVGVNRNRMRDDARAAETQRLAVEKAARERDQYSVETSLPDWVNASRNPDDATLTAAMERAAARPGVNADLVRQTFAPVFAMPPEARAAYMADIANSYAQSRAAREAQYPDVRTISYGSTIGGLPNADPTALTAPIPERAVTLTPAQVQQQQNREEERTTPEFRERNDGETRWLEDINPNSPTFGERRSARTIQPGPGGGRRSRDGPAPRPAQTAPRPAAPDRGSPPPAPPAGTPRGTTQPNLRTGVTWTWDGSRWQ